MKKNLLSGKINLQSDIFFYTGSFFVIILLLFISDFNGLYGQDSYEYLRYSGRLHNFLKSGTGPGDYLWPLNYPLAGALLSFFFKPAFALQLVSVAAFILSAYYMDKTIRLIYNDREHAARIYLLLFYLMSPFALRASVVVMSDMLAIFFVVLTFYHFVLFKKNSVVKNFYGIIFFFSAAVMTRYVSMVILFLPVALACYSAIRKINFGRIVFILIAFLIPLIPHIMIRKNNLAEFLHRPGYELWSFKNLFSNHFFWTDGYSYNRAWNLVFIFYNFFHPGFIFAGAVFLILVFKNKKPVKNEIKISIAAIILYAVFIGRIPFQNSRYLLLSFPFVILVFFPAYKKTEAALNRFKNMHILMLILVVGIQAALAARAMSPFYSQSLAERKIAAEILNYPGKTIYTFSIDGALKNYGVTNKIVNLYTIKIDSVEKHSLILFNPTQLSEQWKGMNPMVNWEFIKSHYVLEKIKDLPRNWELYETR